MFYLNFIFALFAFFFVCIGVYLYLSTSLTTFAVKKWSRYMQIPTDTGRYIQDTYMFYLSFFCIYLSVSGLRYIQIKQYLSVCICAYFDFICIYLSVSKFCLYLWEAGVMHMDLDASAPVARNHTLVSMPQQSTQYSIHRAQSPQFVLYSRSGRVVLVPDHTPRLDVAELDPCTRHTSMITETGKQRLFLPDMRWGMTL